MKTTIVLVIDHKRPIPDLTDIAAGRIYTLDGVEDVTASVAESPEPLAGDIRPRLQKVSDFWAHYRHCNESWQDENSDEAQAMVEELEAVIAALAAPSTVQGLSDAALAAGVEAWFSANPSTMHSFPERMRLAYYAILANPAAPSSEAA